MTDKQFQRLINKISTISNKYSLLAKRHKELIGIAEEEYKKRFSQSPQEVNDKLWIETVYNGFKNVSIEDIEKSAKSSKKKSKNYV